MKRRCRRNHIVKKTKTVVAVPKVQKENSLVIKLPILPGLESVVNDTVIGQESVVKSVCTKIYEGIYFPQIKSNILLVGKSGTGKTEIIKQISENLKLPCTIEDSTRYTEDGYVGSNVTDMVTNLIRAAKGNLLLASRGIIFVDEIDKKTQRGQYQSEVSREGVLKGLLKLVEGTEVDVPDGSDSSNMFGTEKKIKFNTSNIIFIFGGAFEGLRDIRKERLRKDTKIGFTSAEANHIVTNNYMNNSFSKEDLIEYGLPAEFVGRISSIYETKELQIDDLKNILNRSKKSEFRKYEKILKDF